MLCNDSQSKWCERGDEYKYGEIEIAMSIYMDGISVAGGPEEVRKE